MGTDIHCAVEKKQPDGTWKVVDAPFDDYRNYDSFAILADVRNGHGFAGVQPVKAFDQSQSREDCPQI
jgi:hypothetical protein